MSSSPPRVTMPTVTPLARTLLSSGAALLIAGGPIQTASAAPPSRLYGVLEAEVVDVFDHSDADDAGPHAAPHRHGTLIWYLRTANARHRLSGPLRGLAVGTTVELRPSGTVPSDEGPALIVAQDGVTPLQSPSPLLAPLPNTTTNVAVLVLDTSDALADYTPEQVHDAWFGTPATSTHNVSEIFAIASYGQHTIEGDVYGPFTINVSTATCNTTGWGDAGDQAAALAGIDLQHYDKVAYILPKSAANACDASAQGQLGGRRSWSYLKNAPSTYAHELGHNFGLMHAALRTSGGGYSEYGDRSDFMGSQLTAVGLHTWHLHEIGWLPAERLVFGAPDATYTVAAAELPPGATSAPHAIVFPALDGASGNLVVSYRQDASALGRNLASSFKRGISIHRVATTFGSNTLLLANLTQVGQSYVEPWGGLVITQGERDISSATFTLARSCARILEPDWVSLDTVSPHTFSLQVTNRACPANTTFDASAVIAPATPLPGWTVSVSPSALQLGSGQTGTFAVTLTPPPGLEVPLHTQNVIGVATATVTSAHDQVAVPVSLRLYYDRVAPNHPSYIGFTRDSDRKITLRWFAYDQDLANFRIYRKKDTGAFTLAATLPGSINTATTWSENVTRGSKYRYYVQSVDVAGNVSPPSLVVGDPETGNLAPVTQPDAIAVTVGAAHTVDVLANDSDPNGDPLSIHAINGFEQFANAQGAAWSGLSVKVIEDRLVIAPSSPGTFTVTYTARDNRGLTATGTLTVSAAPAPPPPCCPPTAVADTFEAQVSTPAIFDVLANDLPSYPGETLTLCKNPFGGYLGTVQRVGDLIAYTPFPGWSGTETFTYAICGDNGESTSSFSVTVRPAAGPPVANAGPDRLLSDGDGDGLEPVTLTGSGHDPDGGAVTLRWLDEDGYELAPGATLDLTLPLGVHTFALEVTDDEDETAYDQVTVTVISNRSPTANAGPDLEVQTTGSTAPVTLSGAASSDLDGHLVAWTWSWSLAGGAQAVRHGVTLSEPFPLGDHLVTLTVTDNGGASASDTVWVRVRSAPLTMRVADLDATRSASGNTWSASVQVLVRDAAGQPVAGATVSATFTGNVNVGCVTATTGWCSVTRSNIHKNTSSVTLAVTQVAKTGLVYDPAANGDPDGDSDGTRIVVLKP